MIIFCYLYFIKNSIDIKNLPGVHSYAELGQDWTLKLSKDDAQSTTTYSCPKCSYTTCRKQSFQRHRITHTKERLYGCNMCDKKFTLKHSVKRHMIACHPELFVRFPKF